MTVIAEERHYRRGLVLGLTISELMLLLLFILLLLLSHLLREQDQRGAAQLDEAKTTILKLQKENQRLEDENQLVFGRLVELRGERDRLAEQNDQLKDDFDELVAISESNARQLASARETIENTPGLAEIEELKQQADKSESLQNENEELQEALTEKQAELNEAVESATQDLLDGMYNSRKDLIDGVLNEITSGGMENASPDYDDGVLRLPQDVLFDSGEGDLSSNGEQAVDLLADALSKWIPCYTADRVWACKESNVQDSAAKLSAVFIEGHTDNKPVVSLDTVEKYGDNWGLSSARAISAFNRLVQRNRYLQEYKNEEGQRLLSISGYADNRPAADNWTSEGREKNRRIDVRFIFTPNVDGVRKEFSTGASGVVPAITPDGASKNQ